MSGDWGCGFETCPYDTKSTRYLNMSSPELLAARTTRFNDSSVSYLMDIHENADCGERGTALAGAVSRHAGAFSPAANLALAVLRKYAVGGRWVRYAARRWGAVAR